MVCRIVSSIFGRDAPQGTRRLLVASSIHHNLSANHKAASFNRNVYHFLKTFARLAGKDHAFLEVCPWPGSCGSQTQSGKWSPGNRRVLGGSAKIERTFMFKNCVLLKDPQRSPYGWFIGSCILCFVFCSWFSVFSSL